MTTSPSLASPRADDDDDDDDEALASEEEEEEEAEEEEEEAEEEEEEEEEEDEAAEEEEEEEEAGEVAIASATMSIDDVAEKFVVYYSSAAYGVPDSLVLHSPEEPLVFDSSEAMSEMLSSKSAKKWPDVRTKHVGIVQGPERQTPKDFYPGKDGKQAEDYPLETFMYISCYVAGSEGEAYDRRQLQHVPKAVASDLHAKFASLPEDVLTDERRAEIKHILDWKQPGKPQIHPQVARWPAYPSLELKTAFVEKPSKPRPKGPHSKAAREGVVVPSAAVAPSRGKKRAAEHIAMAESDVGSASTAMGTTCSPEAGDKELQALAEASGLKRLRKVPCSAKTYAWVQDGHVWIAEHHA